MRKYCFLAVFGLIFVVFTPPVKADQVNFSVAISSGPQNGLVFTGSYTYNGAILALNNIAPLLSFTFTDPAWSGNTLTSPGVAAATAVPGGLNFFFAPGTGTNDAFGFFGASPLFNYGTTTIVDFQFTVSGTGAAFYSAPIITSTPEPGSLVLLATGILGFIGLAKRPFARA
jgi:hypothetical protein